MNYYSGLSVICMQVYQMVAALTTVAWWFGQFPYIVRRMPHPELEPTCEFRPCHAFTASRRRFFIFLLLLLSPVCTIFCAQENDPGTSASLCRSALTALCHHFGVSSSPLRHLGTGLGDGTLSRIKLGPRHQYQTH